jgi:hypothetical protein
LIRKNYKFFIRKETDGKALAEVLGDGREIYTQEMKNRNTGISAVLNPCRRSLYGFSTKTKPLLMPE